MERLKAARPCGHTFHRRVYKIAPTLPSTLPCAAILKLFCCLASPDSDSIASSQFSATQQFPFYPHSRNRQTLGVLRQRRRISYGLSSLQTHDEIKEAWEFLRQKSSRLASQMVDVFYPGQKVQFSGRRRAVLQGIVKSLNQTTVSVEVSDPFRGQVTWRVAPIRTWKQRRFCRWRIKRATPGST